MSKRKVLKKVLLILTLIPIVVGFVFYMNIRNFSKETNSIEINNIELSLVADGEYIGQCNMGELAAATVKVTVKSSKITSIEFIEHRYGLGKKAEIITDKVIAAQSLKVDTISGATGSSKIILKAIEEALKTGEKL